MRKGAVISGRIVRPADPNGANAFGGLRLGALGWCYPFDFQIQLIVALLDLEWCWEDSRNTRAQNPQMPLAPWMMFEGNTVTRFGPGRAPSDRNPSRIVMTEYVPSR